MFIEKREKSVDVNIQILYNNKKSRKIRWCGTASSGLDGSK
jgi:hypothetical protein